MKILFVTTTLGTRGGIQRVTSVKANCFADMDGIEVAIAFSDRLGWPENEIQPLSPKVKVFDMKCPFWDRDPKRFDILWRYQKKAWNLRKGIKKVIKEFRPDVVISTGQFEKYVLPFVNIINRKYILIREYHFASNYRQIEEYVRFNKISWRSKIINLLENQIVSRFFDSNFLLTKSDQLNNGLTTKRFDYMYNPSSFESVKKVNITNKKHIVLAAGRLTPPKNFRDIIKIWAKVNRRDWILRIIGDGEDKIHLQNLVRDLNISNCVEFPGFTSKVQEEMLQSSIFVGTSEFEGFMLVIVESMSQGCVPVSYDTPYGPSEIITNGDDGYIVGIHDYEAFVEKLNNLISNEELRQQMSMRSIEKSRQFAVEYICCEWIKKYTTLLKQRKLL